ncbi:MAG: serine/threonine protein kinase [Polyangiaceae bacterium]
MEARVQLKPGDEVGSYRLLHQVGVGGSGLVFAAQHVVFGYQRAVKTMRLHEAVRGEDAMARWRREALLLQAIQHGNIVRVHDAGVVEGCFWIAMDLLQGRTLREQIEHCGRIPVATALHYGSQIADGVHAAHEMKVVHRDIKPENVFVTESNEIKVLDLGTAKVHGYGVKTTERYKVIGTPLYMAPEQCEGRKVDARTDIYALGVVLYEMMAGRHPFIHPEDPHPSNQELVTRHLVAEPTPLPDVVSGLPDYIWRVVERAMRKEPGDRYTSMFDFSIAMREARKKAIAAANRHGSPGAAAAVVRMAPAAQHAPPSQAKTPAMVPAATNKEFGPRGTFKMAHLPPPEPAAEVDSPACEPRPSKPIVSPRPRFRLRPWHGAFAGACLTVVAFGVVRSLAARPQSPQVEEVEATTTAEPAANAELTTPSGTPVAPAESEVTQEEIDAVLNRLGAPQPSTASPPPPKAPPKKASAPAKASAVKPLWDVEEPPKGGPTKPPATQSNKGAGPSSKVESGL